MIRSVTIFGRKLKFTLFALLRPFTLATDKGTDLGPVQAMDVDAWPFCDRSEDKEAASAAFQRASDEVIRLAGSVDAFLKLGSLDCGNAIAFLSDALGGLPPPDDIWLPEHVAQLAGLAEWPHADEIPKSERWAYWSARKFLEVCVEHRMGLATS